MGAWPLRAPASVRDPMGANDGCSGSCASDHSSDVPGVAPSWNGVAHLSTVVPKPSGRTRGRYPYAASPRTWRTVTEWGPFACDIGPEEPV